MPQVPSNYNEIKRKLRELKKLEIKVRSNTFDLHKNNLSSQKSELVWDHFFELKDDSTRNVKYSIRNLSQMSKDDFKEVINEYFSYVYYIYYKERESIIDTKIYSELSLPIYTDDAEIKRKLKELVIINHPDNGGDAAKFIEIMEKYKNYKT